QKEKEGADRIENLEQLVNGAVAFLSDEGIPQDMPALFASQGFQEAVSLPSESSIDVLEAEQVMEMTPLAAFLTHASLQAGDNQAQDGQDALQLMTVHSAKGLEFDAVFITGLEEGLFPHENSVQATDGLEEERRLMYVAITRARKRLYLSYAQTRMLHGQTRYNIQSRFMDELPEGVLKWITPKKQAYWFGHTASGSGYASTGSAPEPLAMAVSGRDTSWRIGETVFHKKFGEGVIVGLEGSGAHVRANINFGREGMKLLDLSVAKLERLR
ncbi:MAG: ATP-binding domain-containing protein, partial [Oxalobacter sp.]|nr:ATP-binding domain-containing protein [Oxalobacter sp.]